MVERAEGIATEQGYKELKKVRALAVRINRTLDEAQLEMFDKHGHKLLRQAETQAQLKIHQMTEFKDLVLAEDQPMLDKELVMVAMVLLSLEKRLFLFKEVAQECLD